MARVNVYLPDDLAEDLRTAGLNVSALTQVAAREALAARKTDAWLEGLFEAKHSAVDVEVILAAVRDAADDIELGRR